MSLLDEDGPHDRVATQLGIPRALDHDGIDDRTTCETSDPTTTATRRIAVVPAYNEAATVEQVLEHLMSRVDELIVVDDGSTDDTRSIIQRWMSGRSGARLLCFDRNRGMSAAYYLAFTDVRRRLGTGEVSPDDLIFTVDADGQHDVNVLNRMETHVRERHLDALLARRDLSSYPRYKRCGNAVISGWASLWARFRFHDVESGYRIFRAGALADALDYYRGYRYSETVEVAVILCRLGYRVSNDYLVPVPLYRSRTRLRDLAIDVAMVVVAARRARRRRPIRRRDQQ